MSDDDKQPSLDLEPESPENNKGGFGSYLRRNIVAGLLAIAPLVITVYILRAIVLGLDRFMLQLVPQRYQPEAFLNYDIPGFGLLAGFFLLFVIGVFVRNLLGRRLWVWWENLFSNIPGVRPVYNSIKQIIDTVSKSNSKSFREVVMVEYPRKGIWAIAFVTGTTKGEVQNIIDDEMINVFLPTTPNPTSGFLLFVPKRDIIKLHMTVDQGIKMVISAGIVTPSVTEGKIALKEQKIRQEHAEQEEKEVEKKLEEKSKETKPKK